MVYYDDNALCAISSCIRKLIKIDSNTTLAIRGKFAHVCVEISLTKPLVGQIVLDGGWQKVEYEGLFIVCFHYGCYGHTIESCSEKIAKLKATIAAYKEVGHFLERLVKLRLQQSQGMLRMLEQLGSYTSTL